MMTCDVCLEKHPALWGFSTAAFAVPQNGVHSPDQEWAVCDQCKDAIEHCNIEGLLARTNAAKLDTARCRAFLSTLVLNINGAFVHCTSSDDVLYPRV